MGLVKLGYNDMIGKGWDSAVQESFCWQKFIENGASEDPNSNQFWWVPRVWALHGHAWNWDQHKRHPDGRFLKFPESKGKGKDKEASATTRLLRLASLLPASREKDVYTLIRIATDLGDGTLKIEE